MKLVQVTNRTRGTVVCERCSVADTFWTRVRGLQFRPPLADNEGLWITHCPSVHMIGVRFPIDVLFLSSNNRVTDWVENLPGGFHFYVAQPRQDENGETFGKPVTALELPAGAIARRAVRIGDEMVT